MPARPHDLALEAAADDGATEDDHLGLVLLHRPKACRRSVVGDGGRVLDHVGDVPVDRPHAPAVPRAMDAHEVLEPGPRLLVVGHDRERMPEVRGMVHRGLEWTDYRDVDELARDTDAGVVAAADDDRVVALVLSRRTSSKIAICMRCIG